MRDWTDLHWDKPKRAIIDNLVNDWVALLADPSKVEENYQRFINEHAGLFFGNPTSSLIVISKFEFGNDHKADFVIPHDDGSYGFVYEIVEIESPHDKAFNKAGAPSQALASALKQVQDWRRWLANHPYEKAELLPSKALLLNGDERFNFSIYIGRRDRLLKYDKERRDFEKAHHVALRSFDRLTDKIEQCAFFNATLLASAEESRLDKSDRNELANPFFQAMTFKEWKTFCRRPGFYVSHMYALNARRLIESRRYSALLSVYDNFRG